MSPPSKVLPHLLELDPAHPQPPGSLDCAAYIIRTQGSIGLFGGFTPTLMRQVVGATAWFFPYEYFKVGSNMEQGLDLC